MYVEEYVYIEKEAGDEGEGEWENDRDWESSVFAFPLWILGFLFCI
jgi:hypothetical protein